MKTALVAAIAALCASTALGMDDGSVYKFRPAVDGDDGLYQGYFLTGAVPDGAMCLDGTPGLYYHRPGTGSGANKWYIHHQGGGWCESTGNCYDRSTGRLGSTKDDGPTLVSESGYFSQNASVNPLMYNWNSVFIRYCDGASFSGFNATTQMYEDRKFYYRGKLILEAVQQDLLKNRGLDMSTDVIISGCSAGGLATFLHADKWASLLPASAKVRAMPDSGFFLDYNSVFPGGPQYHTAMRWVFEYQNVSSGVDQACIKGNPDDTWKCFFAEHTAPFVKTPFFALQSEYDAWQLPNILGSTTDAKAINDYGEMLVSRMKENYFIHDANSAFLDSCYHHCGKWGEIDIDGFTQGYALEEWYNKDATNLLFYQDKVFPCDACCSA